MFQCFYIPSRFHSNDQNLYTIKCFTWCFFVYRNGEAARIFPSPGTLF